MTHVTKMDTDQARNVFSGIHATILLIFLISGAIVLADTATTTVTVGNAAPVITNLSLNGGNDIALIEGTFVSVGTTMTVSDANGCSDIDSVTAKAYRGPIGSSGTLCTPDANNCYETYGACTATTTGNQCTGGADTSVEYDCSFQFWFIAEPTDAGSPNASDIWIVAATTTDGSLFGTATNTGETVEVETLRAHDVTATIAYGSLSAGTDTGASNQLTVITNTGNAALDTEISGEDMCTDFPTCAAFVLDVAQQKFGLSDVTYASLSSTLALSPETMETVLAKPTATSTPVTDDVFWGIAIPGVQPAGDYTGRNTFTAVAD